MLWAWETPENLTALDSRKAGVAFLSREILLGQRIQIRPRMQPLHIAANTWLMAVVRIETAPDFISSPALTTKIARDIIAAAEDPTVRGLQIDFDALASQRDFYAVIIRQVHAQLPANFPLSITALTSWCGPQSWLKNLPSGALPIQEAVPMFFRMGGPASTRANAPRDSHFITESLCTGSIGIATDETWPTISPQQRVYVFRPGSWTQEDIAHINAIGYQGSKGVPSP